MDKCLDNLLLVNSISKVINIPIKIASELLGQVYNTCTVDSRYLDFGYLE